MLKFLDLSILARRFPAHRTTRSHVNSVPRNLPCQLHHAKTVARCGFKVTSSFAFERHQRTLKKISLSFEDTRANPIGFKESSGNRTENRHSTTVDSNDTIVALVTPSGNQPGAVEIIRLSGPKSIHIAKLLFNPAKRMAHASWNPVSHKVEYGTLIDMSGALVDEVLLIPMLAPRSYTKEDVIEFQCHGGGICSRRIVQLCIEAGARLAQPGEFTLRAFLNGRLDLSQAENVAQLVSARTVSAAETALAGLQGGFSSLVRSLRAECIDILAEVDARLDFDDELPELDTNLLLQRIEKIWQKVQEALKTEKRGKLLQTGIQVAIIGRPNVGKSSLLNAWSQTDRAIVTDVAGTTRDVVEVGIVVSGFPVKLLDTAGIRETTDIVESIGVERSIIAAQGADVIIMVVNAEDGWTDGDSKIFEKVLRTQGRKPGMGAMMLVVNKIDRAAANAIWASQFSETFEKVVFTSAILRQGFEDLEAALIEVVGTGDVPSGGQMWAVNQRQAEQLLKTSKALERLRISIEECLPMDFWTIDLKEAAVSLGEISGDDVSEEVLSHIFSKFCIGK